MLETQVYKIDLETPEQNEAAIEKAARILKNGGLVAFATETVYGLGALADNERAVARIYEVKDRPADNPLILHIADIKQLSRVAADIPQAAYALARAFWPGPLTMVLKKSAAVPPSVTCGLDTAAVRMPRNEAARALIETAGGAVAAPSANRSGDLSPTLAAHVLADLQGRIDMVIDGGPYEVGLESTIIDLTEKTPIILRPGSVTKKMLEGVIGNVLEYGEVNVGNGFIRSVDDNAVAPPPKAPGMKYTHYAPNAPLWLYIGTPDAVARNIKDVLNQNQTQKTAVLITEQTARLLFDELKTPQNAVILNMGSRDNPGEIAQNLYKLLREADECGAGLILSEGLEQSGIAQAVMNRLTKAATRVFCV